MFIREFIREFKRGFRRGLVTTHLVTILGGVALLAMLGCKNKQLKDVGAMQAIEPQALSPAAVNSLTFGAFGLTGSTGTIDAASLKLKSVNAQTRVEDGGFQSMALTVIDDGQADYFQFTACLKDKPSVCMPGADNPGSFSDRTLVYPEAPEGLNDIQVRPCVLPENAKNPQILCGAWMKTVFVQPVNSDAKVKQLRFASWQAGQNVLDQCKQIRTAMQKYQGSKADGAQIDLSHLINNQLSNLSPEVCQKIMESDAVTGLAEELGTPIDLSATPTAAAAVSTDKKSSLFLSLGSAAVLGGLLTAGLAQYKLQNIQLEQQLENDSDHSLTVEEGQPKNYTWEGLRALGVFSALAGVASVAYSQMNLADGVSASPEDPALTQLKQTIAGCYDKIVENRAVIAKVNKALAAAQD